MIVSELLSVKFIFFIPNKNILAKNPSSQIKKIIHLT